MELIWTLGCILIIILGLLVETVVGLFFIVKLSSNETKSKILDIIRKIYWTIYGEY